MDHQQNQGVEIQGVGVEVGLPNPIDDDGDHVADMDAEDGSNGDEQDGGELAGGDDMEEEDIDDDEGNQAVVDPNQVEPLILEPEPEHVADEAPAQEPAIEPVADEAPAQQQRYNLRPNRARSYAYRYGHSFACVDRLTSGRYDGYLREGILYLVASETNLATPQMSMKKGIKLFGDKGVAAVKIEIQQLHDRGVLKAVHKSDLSWEQIQQALEYLMFLKRKRCGKIKGRGCADGRKQRSYIEKSQSASPTVATEAVFITAVIDALERRVVIVADIPGAFMHSDMDPDVYMRLDGLMAELLLEVDYDMYKPYVTYEKGQPVIYVEMLKALYGTLRAARLFWEKLSAVLKSWGFIMNPYDSCVANNK